MSATRRRGIVMRGGAACQWDGDKYVRVFSARRALHLGKIAGDVETLRESLFLEPASGMDAPDWIPGGGNAQLP